MGRYTGVMSLSEVYSEAQGRFTIEMKDGKHAAMMLRLTQNFPSPQKPRIYYNNFEVEIYMLQWWGPSMKSQGLTGRGVAYKASDDDFTNAVWLSGDLGAAVLQWMKV